VSAGSQSSKMKDNKIE